MTKSRGDLGNSLNNLALACKDNASSHQESNDKRRLEDTYWTERATKALASGFLGPEESMSFLIGRILAEPDKDAERLVPSPTLQLTQDNAMMHDERTKPYNSSFKK